MKMLNPELSSCGNCGSRDLQVDTEHGVSRCKKCGSYMRARPIWVELDKYEFSKSVGNMSAELYSTLEEVPGEISTVCSGLMLEG